MTARSIVVVAICAGALELSGCASMGGTGGTSDSPQTKDGRVTTWRDGNNQCHTTTTTLIIAKRTRRDRIRWRVSDDYNCIDHNQRFRIEFKQGENPFVAGCNLESHSKVQCEVRRDATASKIKYSVRLLANDQVEDPEIQIEM